MLLKSSTPMAFQHVGDCVSDLLFVDCEGGRKYLHKLPLASFSVMLGTFLLEEEESVILLPDISPIALDRLETLVYGGWVGGLDQAGVDQIWDICELLHVGQEQFVVELDDKHLNKDTEINDYDDFKNIHENYNELKNDLIDEKDLFGETDSEYSKDVKYEMEKELTNPIDEKDLIKSDNGHDISQLPVQRCFQCSNCDKAFIYVKSFERHTSKCQPSLANPCNGITRKMRNKKNPPDKVEKFLFVHYERTDEDLLYRCIFPDCSYHREGGLGFKTAGGCRNHQLLHHATESQKLFPCCYCDKKFASNQLRNKHQNLAHNKRFPCQSCGKVFSESTRLAIHTRTHSGEKPFVCEDCGFSCSQRDNLRLHKEFKHPTDGVLEKKFPCSYCSASFLTKSNLTRHMSTHTDIKPFVCHECGKTFKDPWALRQHSFSHGPPKYPCKECDQRFTSPLYLSRHMVRKHPLDGVQPLKCDVCERGFSSNTHLQEHIQSVHQQVKHCCPHCHQPIGRRSSVHRHIKKGRCRAELVVLPSLSG